MKIEFNFYTHKQPRFDLTYRKCGYFDSRPRINISLIYFTLSIIFPWRNEKYEYYCFEPIYGIAIFGNTFWLYTGGSDNMTTWKTWGLPFLTKEFHKKYILGKNDEWIDFTNNKFYYKYIGHMEWKENCVDVTDEESLAKTFYGTWLDKYDNTEIPAKYRVVIRQWRPKWLTWTKLFQIEKKSIDVCFKHEVGSEKESWKGGVLGAGNDFKDNQETPEECFKRMNKERNW